MSEDGPHDRHM